MGRVFFLINIDLGAPQLEILFIENEILNKYNVYHYTHKNVIIKWEIKLLLIEKDKEKEKKTTTHSRICK